MAASKGTSVLMIMIALTVLLLTLRLQWLEPPPLQANTGVEPTGEASELAASRASKATGSIQLVTVQFDLDIRDFQSEEAFYTRLDRIFQTVEAETDPDLPVLVALPEDLGTFTLLENKAGVVARSDTLAEGIERVIRGNFLSYGWTKVQHQVSWPRALFLNQQQAMADIYFSSFSRLADRYDMYVVGGSALVTDDTIRRYAPEAAEGRLSGSSSDVYNTSFLFGPSGSVLGYQKKVRLIALEGPEGLDLVPGPIQDLTPVDTPLGRVGIAVCFDAFQEEVIDQLDALGTDILVQPSANPENWEPWQQEEWLGGAWKAAHSGRFDYVLNPMLTGDILDLHFEGQSSILARPGLNRRPAAGAGAGPPPSSLLGYNDMQPYPEFLRIAAEPVGDAILVATVPHPQAGL